MAKASQPVPLAASLKHLLSVVVDFLVNQNPQAVHKAPQVFTVAANLQPLVTSPKVGLVVEDYLGSKRAKDKPAHSAKDFRGHCKVQVEQAEQACLEI